MYSLISSLVLIFTISLVNGQHDNKGPREAKSLEPYSFAYTAGRAPGHVDRFHGETSDANGVVKGQYSYVDPRYQVRTVQYVADKNGFHPTYISKPNHDTQAVSAAKQKHAALYHKIADDQQRLAATREADGFDDGRYKGSLFYGDDGSYRETHHFNTQDYGNDDAPAYYKQINNYNQGRPQQNQDYNQGRQQQQLQQGYNQDYNQGRQQQHQGYNPDYSNYEYNPDYNLNTHAQPVQDTPEVAQARQQHAELFTKILEEHRKIAAERGHSEGDAPPVYDY